MCATSWPANQSASSWTALFQAAWESFLRDEWVATDRVPCHPGGPGIKFVVTGADVQLIVCGTCLQAFVEMNGLTIGGKKAARERQRVCQRCGEEGPLSDFIARSGGVVGFCGSCRMKWAEQKREEERNNEAREAIQQAQALAAAAAGLKRMQKELQED